MDNGLIIFINENDEKYGFPNPYPGGFSNDTRLPVVAPFWADADISDDGGEVFYQVRLSGVCLLWARSSNGNGSSIRISSGGDFGDGCNNNNICF